MNPHRIKQVRVKMMKLLSKPEFVRFVVAQGGGTELFVEFIFNLRQLLDFFIEISNRVHFLLSFEAREIGFIVDFGDSAHIRRMRRFVTDFLPVDGVVC